jgi:type III pantothenate kinase
MLLAFHVENRRTVLGLFTPPEPEAAARRPTRRLIAHWVLGTFEQRSADEWSVIVRGLLLGHADPAELTGLAISSTVPAVLTELRTMAARTFRDAVCSVVGTGMRTGMPVLTDNPRETGTDRIANAVAAVARGLAPCVVVDCGTATTFDVIDDQGRFTGGVIVPGVETSADALAAHAAQLRRVELTAPRSLIAKNTVEALQSGAVFGFVAQVDGMLAMLAADPGSDAARTVVVTGAFAGLVVEHCRTAVVHEPMLTLEGIAAIHDRNI